MRNCCFSPVLIQRDLRGKSGSQECNVFLLVSHVLRNILWGFFLARLKTRIAKGLHYFTRDTGVRSNKHTHTHTDTHKNKKTEVLLFMIKFYRTKNHARECFSELFRSFIRKGTTFQKIVIFEPCIKGRVGQTVLTRMTERTFFCFLVVFL